MGFSKQIIIATSIVVVVAALFLFIGPGVTGFTVGGQTDALGAHRVPHPDYGAVKGNILWTIFDGQDVISEDFPNKEVIVYFVPKGETVDLTQELNCDRIEGALAQVDADDAGTACAKVTYNSPTSYKCPTNEGIDIYKTTTSMDENNVGCFAAKVAIGEYDIYA